MQNSINVVKTCNTVACIHCGFINHCPDLTAGSKYLCQRCHHKLKGFRPHWEKKISALTLTSIILFICSNSFSFITIEAGFRSQSANLLSGVWALIKSEQILLGLLVLTTIFIFPLIELIALSTVLITKYFNKRNIALRFFLKFLVYSKAWNMLDIFMVGLLITSVKLGETVNIIPGIGFASFSCLIITLLIINLNVNFHALWDWYCEENFFVHEQDEDLFACYTCHATIGKILAKQQQHCPRCASPIRPRIKQSIQKTAALTLTAAILYIPAMALPIMTLTSFGQQSQDTILSGVIHLFSDGQWFIAAIVFGASIVVPLFKLAILSYLLWSVKQGVQSNPQRRQQLFRLTEIIGRWSMIDVFVITLLVALVQFGIIMNVRPEPAALAFAAVVILTMIAVETFDSRLLWEQKTPADNTHD